VAAIKILCGAPISEDASVFKAHVESLLAQGYVMDYKGIDNSPEKLESPKGFNSIEWRREPTMGEYKQRRSRWDKRRIRKVGEWREELRLSAISGDYDYLFMVDSDLILGEDTLGLLLKEQKDFISGVVWTKFRPNKNWKWVNVFDINGTTWANIDSGFRNRLRGDGGVHQAQMTGACSLISRNILGRVSYAVIPGVVGEDLCLAIRARDANIPLYAHAGVKIEHRRRR